MIAMTAGTSGALPAAGAKASGAIVNEHLVTVDRMADPMMAVVVRADPVSAGREAVLVGQAVDPVVQASAAREVQVVERVDQALVVLATRLAAPS